MVAGTDMAISTVVINDEVGLYVEVPDLPVRWMRLQLDAMLRKNGRVTAIEQGDVADTAARIVENANAKHVSLRYGKLWDNLRGNDHE